MIREEDPIYKSLQRVQDHYLIEKEKLVPKQIVLTPLSNEEKTKIRQVNTLISFGKNKEKWLGFYAYLVDCYSKNWQREIATLAKKMYCNHD